MSVVGNLIKHYPRLPALFANIMVSKVIQLIKTRALEPIINHSSAVRHIQDLPKSLQKGAEWIFYFLSGAIRTMPERGTVMGIIAQEALAESLTQTGIKINELSAREYGEYIEVIDASQPVVHAELVGAVKKDRQFRDCLDAIFGTTHDWKEVLREADDFVSRVDKQTQAHREARRARSWWRRLL
ncbi:MAG: hypothetical protein V1685_00965 [Parcubacteria group bacterium]